MRPYVVVGLKDEIKVHCGGVKNLGVNICKKTKTTSTF